MEKNRLSALVLFFVLLFAAAIGINKIVSGPYKMSNIRIGEQMAHQELFISYEALHAHLSDNSLSSYQLLDLREEEAYVSGHLQGAINIPLQDLPDKKARRKLEKKTSLLLYAEEEHQAAAAQMILSGLGYEQVQYIPGGYDDIASFVLHGFKPSNAFYRADKARFDFPRFIKAYAVQKKTGSGQSFQIPEAGPPATAAGGC